MSKSPKAEAPKADAVKKVEPVEAPKITGKPVKTYTKPNGTLVEWF